MVGGNHHGKLYALNEVGKNQEATASPWQHANLNGSYRFYI